MRFIPYNRRGFLLGAGAALLTTRGLFAEKLRATPDLTEGPYYPDKLPLDRDNDLIVIGDSLTPAVGEITRLSGRILDAGGSPLKNTVIEIWQTDSHGVYINSNTPDKDKQDKNFQGYGQFLTGSAGEYLFRTVKPVPYQNRCPHIHFRVKKQNQELLTSQIFVNGHSANRSDGVFGELRSPIDRELVLADFVPVPQSKTGELTARFDIVVGRTPDERRRA